MFSWETLLKATSPVMLLIGQFAKSYFEQSQTLQLDLLTKMARRNKRQQVQVPVKKYKLLLK